MILMGFTQPIADYFGMITPMSSLDRLTRRFAGLIAVSMAALASACGSSEDWVGKRYAVSGTVTYHGSPLEKGAISFVPEDGKGVGATGTIENGAYTLSTGGNNDGAQAGKYKVTITSKEDSSAKAKSDFAKANAKGVDPGYVPGRYVAAAERNAKSLIPVGYGDVNTTNLTAEVKEQPNTIDFPLSDANAPKPPSTKK
jgi:hypothetical protein